MCPQNLLTTAVTVLVVRTVATLVAGSLLGQPIFLSYVETGSTIPELDEQFTYVSCK